MIKTLRITSIVAAVLAVIFVIFFVFPVVFGVSSDDRIKELLNSPGVIEKFNLQAVGNKASGAANQSSPLVQQAGAFALYLNPPKPKTPSSAKGLPAGIARGTAVTPKFKVLGTSFYEGRPELSIALIDEPGKGLHWVRQSGKVGHLLIEQVKDGIVVFNDGNGTFEQKAEQKQELSLLEGDPAVRPERADVSRSTSGAAGSRPALPASRRTDTGIKRPTGRVPQPRRTAEEDAKMKELVERLREIQESFKSDKAGSGPIAKEKAAMMENLISEFRSSRLSAEETERLSNLGKELEKFMEEPNRSVPEENKDN